MRSGGGSAVPAGRDGAGSVRGTGPGRSRRRDARPGRRRCRRTPAAFVRHDAAMTGASSLAAPRGYTTRAATWEDLASVVELFRQSDLADWGEVDVTEAAIRHDWEDPSLDLAADTWLVFEETSG